MALVHRAELRPTKLELLASWLPTRGWYRGSASVDVRRVGSYRFDDPAGAVGIETMLVRAGDGPLLQAPLTYRGAPLAGGARWLVGTADHSVLGQRWVYDACGDPVYASVLASTIVTGASQADVLIDVDGRLERLPADILVRGSGHPGADGPTIHTVVRVVDDNPTRIITDSVELAVVRILDDPGSPPTGPGPDGQLTLTGTWNDQPTPLLLAFAWAA